MGVFRLFGGNGFTARARVHSAATVLVLWALAGCNSQDAKDLTRDVGQVAKTATRAAGNAQLVVRVNAALAQRKGVDVSGLHIENTGGTVTVGGHVRSKQEKATVLSTVKEIRGVDKVVDKLRIEPKG